MATAQTSGGVDGDTSVVNARDFARQRLQNAETPVQPSELASEYGCSNGHMRNVLRELRDDGDALRVERGLYAHPDSEIAAESDGVGDGSADASTFDGGSVEGPDFLSGGGPQLEDTDTEGEDAQEDDEMPTDDELDRQRSQLVEDGDDQEAADDQLEDREDHADDLDGELPGIPIEAVAVVVIVAFGVYWFVLRGSSSDEEDEQRAQQTQPQPPSGGLVEGV